MKFEERTIGKVFIAKILESRITAEIAPALKAGIVEFIGQGHRTLVLDLSEVTFIDSSGLGALIGSLKALGDGGELALSGAKDMVASMFKLTRMNEVFRMYKNPEEAAVALA